MRSMKMFTRYWLPVCVLCAAIFIQSSFAVPDVGIDPLLWGWLPVDKLAHGIIYAALSALVCRAVFNAWRPRVWQKLPLAAIGITAAVVFGLSDEWHQSFVAARSADALDLAADAVGAIVGALLYLHFVFGIGNLNRPS